MCHIPKIPKYLLTMVLFLAPNLASATEFYCKASRKMNGEQTYTAEDLKNWKFATKVEQQGNEAFLSRCSHSRVEEKVTCDRYEVDRIEFDQNVKIKKYYVFESQFNLQIFSNMTYLEDNGRGGITYGRCEVVSP